MYTQKILMQLLLLFGLTALNLAVGKPKMYQLVTEGITQCANVDTRPFVRIGNKYYLIETQRKVNWFAAAHICRSIGANLAAIETRQEMVTISNYLSSRGFTHANWFWLSGNDLAHEGSFQWLANGKNFLYANWSPGQPDNAGGNENCVHLWRPGNEWTMNDWVCNGEAYFICQANMPVTITTTIWQRN